MAKSASPFLMFMGNAEQAVNLYLSLFPEAKLEVIQRYGSEGVGPEGALQRGILQIAGQDFVVFDSTEKHEFGFTPSFSIFIECADQAEFERLYAGLSEDGAQLMPADNYGFSSRFAWVNDRFGLSWQLNLA